MKAFSLMIMHLISASKFAVQGFCESLRAELASSAISVHIVSPGYIRTNLSMNAKMGDGQQYNKNDANTQNGADPDDVAVEIIMGANAGKSDMIIDAGLSATIGMWIRFLFPSFFQKLMERRYEKSIKQ